MKLNFKQLGDEGTPMIILHGLFGSLDNWFTLGKKFAEDFKVYLIDQRNHGNSPHSDEWTYEAMANDLLEFMEDQSIDRAIVIGHSMGGKTAMQFAANHSSRLEKLIVVDIGPQEYDIKHKEILDALNAMDLSLVNSRKDAEKQLGKHIKDFGIKQFLLKNLKRKNGDEFEWKMNLPVITEEIENVGVGIDGGSDAETLFISGTNSDYISKSDHEKIKEQYPNAKIVELSSGHWVHAEVPKEFYETVVGFVAS